MEQDPDGQGNSIMDHSRAIASGNITNRMVAHAHYRSSLPLRTVFLVMSQRPGMLAV